jgi:hypothetical protein
MAAVAVRRGGHASKPPLPPAGLQLSHLLIDSCSSIFDVGRLFDRMHPGESSKRAAPPALSSGGSFDALPDGVLEHILGFLPAPEAVQTCVLSRRWLYLWRSAPGLRVGWLGDGPGLHVGWPGDDEQASPPVKEHRELVDRLLLLRGGSPLDTCDIRLGEFQDDDVPRVNFWVWHAISCKVRQFTLSIHWHSYLN